MLSAGIGASTNLLLFMSHGKGIGTMSMVIRRNEEPPGDRRGLVKSLSDAGTTALTSVTDTGQLLNLAQAVLRYLKRIVRAITVKEAYVRETLGKFDGIMDAMAKGDATSRAARHCCRRLFYELKKGNTGEHIEFASYVVSWYERDTSNCVKFFAALECKKSEDYLEQLIRLN
jgi:hypothetical protein